MNQTETRDHKVKCHYGIKDYYNSYKKSSKKPVSSKLYSAILKEYLKLNQINISLFGYIFNLPKRLGRIELRKIKREVKIKDGKIINNLPINWKGTKKLWSENPEAAKKKVKLRYSNEHSGGYVYRIVYVKYTANYKNKSIYKMQLNREMRRNTEKSILNKKVDAFLLIPNN